MRYSASERKLKQQGFVCGDTIYACAFQESGSNSGNLIYRQKPTKGLLWYEKRKANTIEQHPEKDIRFFIPCKQNNENEFAWSKAVYIESRMFAETKEQCDKLYQRCIKSELYKHIITCNMLLKMAEEDNVTNIDMNDFSPKQINAITKHLLDKPDGHFNVDEIAILLSEFHTYLTSGEYLGPNLLYKTSITETDIKDTMTAFENFLVKHDIKTFHDVWIQFGC